MGNQQCNQCKETRIESYAYGAHELVHQNQYDCAIVQKLVQGDQRLKRIVEKQLQTRKSIVSLHVARLYKYKIVDEAYGFKTIMEYEYLPKSLRNREEEMKEKDQAFSQRQIFAIIYGVEQGLHQLFKNGIKHCCINMDTILCKNNIYKITDVSSTTYVTSYDLVNKGDREQFLSEKILCNIFNKSLNPTYELKDDLFSLGMIALTIASRKQAKHFYQWNQKGQGTLKIFNIQTCLKQIQKNYSSKLVKKIKSLIYDGESQNPSDDTNLTDNLISLDEEYNRVLQKAKKVCSKTKSQNQTIACTPNRPQFKVHSFKNSPYHS